MNLLKGAQRIYSELSLKMNDDGTYEVPEWIQLIPCGNWNGSNHGDFVITEGDIARFVEVYGLKLRAGYPIDREHYTDDGAYGWVEELQNRGAEGLWGRISWTTEGRQMLSDRKYRFFSPEFWLDGYPDPETGREYSHVLIGGALTNRPFFKGLQALRMSETGDQNAAGKAAQIIYMEEDALNIEDVRKKDLASLTEAEKTFLADHKEALTADERSKFGLEAAAPAPVAPAVTPEPVKASEGKKFEMSEAQYNELKAAAERGTQASETLRKNDATKFAEGLIAKGQIKGDQTEDVVSALLASEGEARTKIEKIFSELPENEALKAGEQGGDKKGAAGTFTEQMTAEARKLMSENDKLTLAEAMLEVGRTQPELYKQYNEEVEGK